MIFNDINTILHSIFFATIYGVLFAITSTIVSIMISLLSKLPEIIREVFVYDGLFSNPKFLLSKNTPTSFSTFASVLCFTLGFIILSYYSLDGEIRIYMFIISTASYYLARFAFCAFFEKIFSLNIRVFLQALIYFLRAILYPFVYFVRKIK